MSVSVFSSKPVYGFQSIFWLCCVFSYILYLSRISLVQKSNVLEMHVNIFLYSLHSAYEHFHEVHFIPWYQKRKLKQFVSIVAVSGVGLFCEFYFRWKWCLYMEFIPNMEMKPKITISNDRYFKVESIIYLHSSQSAKIPKKEIDKIIFTTEKIGNVHFGCIPWQSSQA